VYGFFEEILENIEDEKLSDCTRQLIRKKFGS
jgi:hypothetical protein